MAAIRRNPGYPVPYRAFPAPPDNPRFAKLNEPPSNTIANPGQYESISLRSGGFGVGPVLPYTPPINVTWRSDFQFNCLEVDMECIATPRGWAVPDKIAIGLDPTNRPRDVQIPDLTTAIWVTSLTGSPWYLQADFVFNPPKIYVDPVVNDPTLSASMFGGRLLRWYGTTPFSRIGIAGWARNDATPAGIQNIDPAQQPWFHVRRWYDPARRVLQTA